MGGIISGGGIGGGAGWAGGSSFITVGTGPGGGGGGGIDATAGRSPAGSSKRGVGTL